MDSAERTSDESRRAALDADVWSLHTRLAGGLVHEIKNPLGTIQLHLQLMREDLAELDGQKTRRVLKRIDVLEREVKRLNELLQSYLQFARAGVLTFEPLDLNRLLRELVAFLQADLRKQSVEVLEYYDPDLPRSPLDARQLKQALLNIMINAKQAMPQGGQLIVRTAHDDQHVTAEITDTGHGIPADKLDRIFDAFFSTKRDGSGLGLATTKRIIDGHGGRISVQSEVGKGTLVRINLPRDRNDGP